MAVVDGGLVAASAFNVNSQRGDEEELDVMLVMDVVGAGAMMETTSVWR